MKAKLIKSLRIDGKAVRPVKGSITLVDLEAKEFQRLEAMGVVAKPSSDDLKLAKSDTDDGAAAEKAAAEKAAAEKAAAEKAAAEKAAAAKKTETKGGTGKKSDDDL